MTTPIVQETHTELSRDLSLFGITMIGGGAMIDAGIFVLTGIAAGAAGPALMLSFALNGIITKLFLAVFMFNYSPIAWYFTIAWLGLGFALYYVYARPRVCARSRAPVILEERSLLEPAASRYQVLVPIANRASLPLLLRPAIKAAQQHDGRIVLLHVITVPEQLPLSVRRQYVDQSKALTNQALRLTEEAAVPAEVLIRIAHRPAEAIVHTAHERNVNLLIMGWQAQNRAETTFIGRKVDRIVAEVNCEALLIQQRYLPPFQRILIPIADPLQAPRALRAAHLLTKDNQVTMDVVPIVAPHTAESERQRFIHALDQQLGGVVHEYPELDGNVTRQEVAAPDAVDAIVHAAHAHDCIVLGTTRDSWLKQQLLGSKPAQIAQQVKSTVVLINP